MHRPPERSVITRVSFSMAVLFGQYDNRNTSAPEAIFQTEARGV